MRSPRSLLLATGLMLLPALGCGPVAFSDGSALAIVGTAPEPEPEPEAVTAPEPEPEPEAPKRVEVRSNKIVISEKVQFEKASDKILDVSHDLLNEVAQVIKENPQLKKMEIQGHASADGNDGYNLKLSGKRAKAVLNYLVKTGGVSKDVLSSKGYGEKQPIADNETEDGRIANRRVDFIIVEQEVTKTKVEVGDGGEEKVLSEKTKAVKKSVDEETGEVKKKGKGKGKKGKGKKGKGKKGKGKKGAEG